MDIDPKIELHIEKTHKQEREAADTRYAKKIVEKIVFYVVGAVGIAFLGALIKLTLI